MMIEMCFKEAFFMVKYEEIVTFWLGEFDGNVTDLPICNLDALLVF